MATTPPAETGDAPATAPAARAAAASPTRDRTGRSIVIGAIATLIIVGIFLGGMLAATVFMLMSTPKLPF
jgi:hypothetical protein